MELLQPIPASNPPLTWPSRLQSLPWSSPTLPQSFLPCLQGDWVLQWCACGHQSFTLVTPFHALSLQPQTQWSGPSTDRTFVLWAEDAHKLLISWESDRNSSAQAANILRIHLTHIGSHTSGCKNTLVPDNFQKFSISFAQLSNCRNIFFSIINLLTNVCSWLFWCWWQ